MPRLTLKLTLLLFLCGILAGLIGLALMALLQGVQELLFCFPQPPEASFRLMVEHASAGRRMLALTLCGLIGGLGWWLLHRYGRPLVSIKQAVRKGTTMPAGSSLLHGLLQIITVGMGSPLGRENAPREISAALSNYFFLRADTVSRAERQLVLGCAAAAGLAAVYDAPLAGTLFALETLLLSWHYRALLSALICCLPAAAIVHWFGRDHSSYTLSPLQFTNGLWGWSLMAAPILAVTAYALNRQLQRLAPKNRQRPAIIFQSILAFGVIGLLASRVPEILGNGRAGNELMFHHLLSTQDATVLLVAKWLSLLLTTWAGAYGGRITPAMMIGGLLTVCLAGLWNSLLPSVSVVAAALIGATVFLGLLQRMPLTAVILMLELTHFPVRLLLPLALCLICAVAIQRYLEKRLQPSPD